MEQPALLKALSTKEAFNQYAHKLDRHPLSKEGQWIVENYQSWYDEKGTDIDFSQFTDYCLSVKYSTLPIEKKEIYGKIIDNIRRADSQLVSDIVLKWCTDDKLLDVQHTIDRYLDGELTLDSVSEALRDTGMESDVEGDYIKTFATIDYSAIASGRYKWKLSALNEVTGGIGGGDLAIVFGRPNSGKTSFIVSETAEMLKTIPADKYILWINNEEAMDKILLRYISCLKSVPTSEVEDDWANLCSQFYNGKGKQIVAMDKPAITKAEVENLLDKYPPAVVVFNNLDKIIKTGKDSMHKELGLLYQWAREIAKTYDASVFAVCQCAEQGEGKSVLYQNMLQDSRTDKAGEADVIIGIGRKLDDESMDADGNEFQDEKGRVTRYLNVCKNKLSSGSKPGARELYGRVVKFNTQSGSYEDNKPEEFS